ncbi:PD-(D/E)XK nuclease family protein [Gracilinema caldarium]|uniref:PD-(D/E)XK nuclease family protein n=1 Tax=Gracilinema caldarium TaxID=215591 RepID=UPI0026F14D45|nr:PD-(D/E)XK nuclease family protein [Gracilinema caldarium]
MAKTTLQSIFNSYIDDRRTVFVFPSAVPAQDWARRLCERNGKPLALERFIAWDEFKERTLSIRRTGERPSNSLSRLIFASHILEKNAREAQAGTPLFTELLPQAHAAEYTAFINHVGALLPSLKTLMEKAGGQADPYLLDLRILYHSYEDFLAAHRLYEPDWVRSPFQAGSARYVILFANLADDWEAYEAEISRESSVIIYTVQDILKGTIQIDEDPPRAEAAAIAAGLGHAAAAAAGAAYPKPAASPGATGLPGTAELPSALNNSLLRFTSAQEEIRFVANLLAHVVHNKILEPEDIAVSIANLEDYAEELRLECRLRSLSLGIRQGTAITDQAGGRLFLHLQSCSQSRWSYQALKELLTDRALPWKNTKIIQKLLGFGLTYRCLTGYWEQGKEVDVWEKTFEHIQKGKTNCPYPVTDLSRFYRQLKRDIMDIVNAKTFQELQEKLIYFGSNHFDRALMDAEADRVYARAMEELGRLIETKQYLNDFTMVKVFPVFLAHLKSTTYVHQSKPGSIAVYPYRVAAGIAPKLHIVMNATQDSASILVDPAPFLREDRKRSLDFSAIDRSEAFIAAYRIAPLCFFTAPDRGLRGHGIPHQAISSRKDFRVLGPDNLPFVQDCFIIEETKQGLENLSPFTVQQEAWRRSRALQESLSAEQNTRKTDIRRAPIGSSPLVEALYAKLTTSVHKNPNHISPTDINNFINCPFQWLLTRGLGIEELELEIETIGQKDIGILYHLILEEFFQSIAQSPGQRIRRNETEAYKCLIQEIMKRKLEEQRNREGAFQESVYEMLAERIQEHLFAYLDQELPGLDSCAVLGPEYPLNLLYENLGIYLSGKADLILMDNEGKLFIVDFKTKKTPKPKELYFNNDGLVTNLQMASYIKMAEAQIGSPVGRAVFYSIEERKNTWVVHPEGPKNKRSPLPLPRLGYEGVLEHLDMVLTDMVASIREGSFPVVDRAYRSICSQCPVKAVCRITFSGGDKE